MRQQLKAYLLLGALLGAWLQPSLAKIEQVHIALGHTSSSVWISWADRENIPHPHLSYRSSQEKAWHTVSAHASRYPYSDRTFYRAKLQNLRPSTRYFYHPEGEPAQPIFSFQTLPQHPTTFHFTAAGDMGISHRAEELVQAILREKPSFHLHLGDISYANGFQPIWDRFFRMIQPLAASIFYMPTLGNHENEWLHGKKIGYLAYQTRFALPSENYYSFQVGAVRFLAVNSDDPANRKQRRWIKKEVQEAKRKNLWTVVFQHHPPYGSTRGRGNNALILATLADLYEALGVDLVLCGHDHNYQRTYPMRHRKPTTSEKHRYTRHQGTLYLTSGGAGAPLYSFTAETPPSIAFRQRAHHYLSITFTESQGFLITAKSLPKGKELDRFSISP